MAVGGQVFGSPFQGIGLGGVVLTQGDALGWIRAPLQGWVAAYVGMMEDDGQGIGGYRLA